MSDDSPAAPARAPAGEFPAAAADQCVKCGMCLPHCPTYRVTRDEAESPRGRIALMQGLAAGALPPGPALQAHLDGCLTCRACESVCPADVPYGRLIDSARALLAARVPGRGRLARAMGAVLARRWLRFVVAVPLWLYQRLGLQRLVRGRAGGGRGSLARLESLLPRVHLPHLPRAAATPGGEPVALFADCTTPLVEPQALDAAVSLLQALGCAVRVPAAQGCCGAIPQHAGLAAGARACVARNVAAFDGAGPVLGVASGCTAQLVEYGHLAPDAGAADFAARARDIHAFLAGHARLGELQFAPMRARVLLHTPCTQRNVLRAGGAVRALLARVPGLEVQEMDAGCCGAAGSHFLSHPDMADALAAGKVEQARRARPDYVLSANAGCAMHLGAALRRGGVTVPVWHPLRLLAGRLAPPAGPRAAAAAVRPVRPG
jgi:glycolate oxidase iron-sulfur subunit